MYLQSDSYPDLSPSELKDGISSGQIRLCQNKDLTDTQTDIILKNLMEHEDPKPGFTDTERILSICGIGTNGICPVISFQTTFLDTATGNTDTRISSYILCHACPMMDFCPYSFIDFD